MKRSKICLIFVCSGRYWYYRYGISGYINTDLGVIGVELTVTLTQTLVLSVWNLRLHYHRHWCYRCGTYGYINTDIGVIGVELTVTLTQTLVLSAWNVQLH